MINNIIKYSGSKTKYLDTINSFINLSDKTIYCEPFIGSGVIFFNLEKQFEKYYINDLDSNLCLIFETVKKYSYSEFIEFYNNVINKFGDIKKNKESYYNFRNSFNDKLWKTNTKEEGFGLILLYNLCINSMARFGPNGFNSSFGNRLYISTELMWNNCQNILNKCVITNLDFFDFIKYINKQYNEDELLLMLDPPYIKRETSYKTISNSFYIKYINYLKEIKSDVIYTDIEHDDLLNYNKIILREMRNSSPNRLEEYTNLNEVILTNIKYE